MTLSFIACGAANPEGLAEGKPARPSKAKGKPLPDRSGEAFIDNGNSSGGRA